MHPVFGHLSDLSERSKQVQIKQLISIGSIEAFDVGVLCWFSRLDEVEHYVVFIGPISQRQRDKLRTIIDSQFFRVTAEQRHPLQDPDHSWCRYDVSPKLSSELI